MNCPGSVALLAELRLVESDEPDYRREGTAMHEAAAKCLIETLDSWEIAGETFNNTIIDGPMADAIQVYVDFARKLQRRADRSFVEYKISSPVHKDFFGTLDFAALTPHSLSVADLKGGEGIIVEPEENPQTKYYAFGIIDGLERQEGFSFGDEFPVNIAIVQPRGYHADGPIRTWTTTAGAIKEWVNDTLVPAMLRTEMDDSLNPGEWCRFCPAKLVCPVLTAIFKAAAVANPKHLVTYADATLGLTYGQVQGVKFYIKAIEEEAFGRLNRGGSDELHKHLKLVHKRANRVFKDGAEKLAEAKFGADALNPPTVKTPAQLEAVSPGAKKFVQEFAYMPIAGLTVALADDKRVGVKVAPTSEKITGYLDSLKQEAE